MEILNIKTRNRMVGDFGEKVAEKLLKKKNFRIIERNFVAVGHEIDIIAEDRDTQIFVEVKCREEKDRSDYPNRPAAAVNRKKQQAIIKAASYYIGFNPSNKKKRFDVIEVYVKDFSGKLEAIDINHIEGAFTVSDAY